jgi:O-succinylhomoserine sulfhydrylase
MSASQRRYRPETNLVHAGTLRSEFGETSEALFLTQGYVYDSAAQAERRFNNTEPGFQYSRCSKPAWRRWKAPRRRAPPRPAWRR